MGSMDSNYYNSDIEIYKDVLLGKRKKFPNGYWNNEDSYENAKICTRYMFENILNCKTKEDFIKFCTTKTFIEYKLKGMCHILFNNSCIQVYDYVYNSNTLDEDKKIYPWEFNQSPIGYWKNKENIKLLIPWLFKQEEITDKNIYSKYNYSLFLKYGVTTALEYFNHSPYEALVNVFPTKKYKPWLFEQSYIGIWEDRSMVKDALLDIFAKNNITDLNIYDKYNNHFLIQNGLKSLLKKYNNNSFKILEEIFPNKYELSKFRWNIGKENNTI